ncbi:MAG TPA: DNA translocase FtsK 4TM domain-containing protein [Myxococcaceae bacterium]|nr:DNA translocase FtsK 4TM domain-containing protein [Myxococcaceae bacterium]
MAAAKKTARSEKTVLTRQEIASRRKALNERKMETGNAGARAIVGVFVLAASFLALFSVGTFDVRDRRGPGFNNAIGPVGHGIAEALLGLLGICAYVVPISGLYASLVIFVGSRTKRRGTQILAGVLLMLSVAVLAELAFGSRPAWGYTPGGWVGGKLSGMLVGWFSTVGTVILVSALAAVGLIFGTQMAFLKICALVWRGVTAAAEQARVSALALWEEQKQAAIRRKEEAERARQEEAAFLAQLEADEEELLEAEREAAEAEAMADEALRLAKEAEAKQLEAQKLAAAEKAEKEKKKGRKGTVPVIAGESEELESSAEAAKPVPEAKPETKPSRGPKPAPGADPAWATAFLPPPPVAAPVQAAPEPPVTETGSKRRKPQITLPSTPAAQADAHASSPRMELPAQEPVAAPVPPPVAAAAPASTSTALAVVPPAGALARMPVIVEPKAPPKPTKPKEQNQFEFVGDRKSFTLPPLDVLEADKKERSALDKEAFLSTAEKLRAKLADFGIVGEVVEIRPGPVVTMYEFLPGPGIKVSKIAALADDLAMAMEAMRVRIVAPIPGKGVVGIEVPNRDRETVFLKEIAEQDAFTKSASRLTMCVGKDIEGMPYVFDLAKAPHLLIAGTTGSGKSVAVNSMIMSILLKSTPEEVRFIMVDPKMLELSVYEGIPHLLLPVVTDPKKAALALRWAVEEMERRYQMLSEAGVRNIAGFNKLVETTQAEAKTLQRLDEKKPASIKPPKKDDKPQAEAKPASFAEPPKPAKKLLIVDVAEGETEDEALERRGLAPVGVPAPKDELEDAREAVEAAPEEAEVAPVEEAPVDEPLEAQADEAEPAEAQASGEPEKKELKKLPYIVVIIDELADLMMVASREVETYVARLAQMARAAGIHLMVATQRPSTDVVTGIIKANFPTRISFMLRSKPDSMTILGTVGAEALLGMGDMLIMPPTSAHLQRVHGAYVSEHEIKRAVDHLKAQGKPVYDESILKAREEDAEGGGGEEDELSDELYDQALATVSEMRQVSISMLQRKMRIGYNRAARMIERMERDGVVGPADGAKPREVLLRPVGDMPGAGAM